MFRTREHRMHRSVSGYSYSGITDRTYSWESRKNMAFCEFERSCRLNRLPTGQPVTAISQTEKRGGEKTIRSRVVYQPHPSSVSAQRTQKLLVRRLVATRPRFSNVGHVDREFRVWFNLSRSHDSWTTSTYDSLKSKATLALLHRSDAFAVQQDSKKYHRGCSGLLDT